MASISTDLKIMNLAYGEEGAYGYTNYGDLYDANLSVLESALTGQSAITVTTANVTLSDAQQQSLHLNLSGLLTGNRSILLGDGQKGLWFVTNGTTGAYTITIKPTSGSGFVLDQGKRAWVYCDGTTAYPIVRLGDALSQETVATDADFTLTWNSNADTVRHNGTLTADRAVTLSTSGATKGARWRITRTGSGNFSLNVGTGPLAALRQNMWAEFVFDGSAWYLDKHGVLVTTAFAQTLLDDADASSMRVTLGLVIGTNVQAYDETLAAWANYNTNGLLTQTAADTFTGRTITGTSNEIDVSNGNGVSANPTIGLADDIIVTTSITVPNTGLHILDTNSSHDLIIKPGSNITADRTFTLTTGDADRNLTLASDVSITSFAATMLDDADAAAVRTTLGMTSAGGLDYIGVVNASASASVEFTSLPTTYDQFILALQDVILSGGSVLALTVSDNNGSSYLSSNYSYSTLIAGGTPAGAGGSSQTQITLVTASPSTGDQGLFGEVRIFTGDTGTFRCTSMLAQSPSTAGLKLAGGGVALSGTKVNAVKVHPLSGTITGNVKLYGVKNS